MHWLKDHKNALFSKDTLKIVSVGVVYFILAYTSILLYQKNVTLIWTPNAFVLVCILRSSSQNTWKYFSSAMLANIIAHLVTNSSVLISLSFTLCSSTEILLPILLIKVMLETPIQIERLDKTILFLLLAILIGCISAGIIGASLITINKFGSFRNVFAAWFTSNFIAMITIVPVGLSITIKKLKSLLSLNRTIEFALFIIAAIWLNFFSIHYTTIPFVVMSQPLLFAAIRFDFFTTALLCFISGLTFSILTTFGITPEAMQGQVNIVAKSNFLMSLSILPALAIALLNEQRRIYSEQLGESESRFRGAMEYSALGMTIMSLEYKWIAVNNALCQITGYTENELLKLNFADIIYPPDLNMNLEDLNKIATGEIQSFKIEQRCLRKNGEIIWIFLVASAVYANDGKVLYFILQMQDINKRKLMEKALQESEERWKFALESGGQGVWDLDPRTGRVYLSKAWKSLLGYTENEIGNDIGEWVMRIHPEDRKRVIGQVKCALDGISDAYLCEYRIECKDKSFKWVLDRGKIISTSITGHPTRMIGTYTDIDQLKQAEEDRNKLTQRLLLAIEAGKIGIFEYDIKNNKLDWDDRMLEIYGIERDEFITDFSGWASRVHPDDIQLAIQNFQEALTRNKEFNTEYRIVLPNGEIREIREKGVIIRDRYNFPTSFLGVNWDITNEKKLTTELYKEKEKLHQTLASVNDLQHELKFQATHDALTLLINRREFENKLHEVINSKQATHHWHSLCYIDLDKFKIVNDTAGHAAGDKLLKQICTIIQNCVRDSDILARLGGDEFGLLLPDCQIENAISICDKIILALNDYTFMWDEKIYDVGASIGIVNFLPQSTTIESLMSQADVACYAAKNQGGNSISVYVEKSGAASHFHTEIKIITDIKDALENGRFHLLAHEMRPIVDRQKQSYYELLIRLVNKEGKVILPNKFIPAAERYNLMVKIDEWVIRKVLIFHAKEIAAIPNLAISINLSANSINTPAFLRFLFNTLETTPIPKTRIGFELTETAVINHIKKAGKFLQMIQNQGCFISLDDFGTGLSSFNYLKHYPVKYIKIDGSFVKAIANSNIDRAIVESINQLAHRLNTSTIAEFVETHEVLDILHNIGVDYAQGRIIAKEVPLEELMQSLKVKA